MSPKHLAWHGVRALSITGFYSEIIVKLQWIEIVCVCAMKSSPRSPQLEKARGQQRRPNTAKDKNFKKE